LSQRTNANAGTWWSFTTGDVPGSFTKWLPGNNSNAQPGVLNLTWNSTGSTTDTYDYCIDTTDNNTCDTTWISTGTSTGVTIGGLSSLTSYYWHVRAVNLHGVTEADGGAWWAFTTGTVVTHTVTNDHGSGAGSLRQALADAGTGDTILFDNDYTIYAGSTLVVDEGVNIDGSGHSITISGNRSKVTGIPNEPHIQVFNIQPDLVVSMKHLSVVDGSTSAIPDTLSGGGISNSGTLALTDCTIYFTLLKTHWEEDYTILPTPA
jgi:hypothetical protein